MMQPTCFLSGVGTDSVAVKEELPRKSNKRLYF